MGRAWYDNGKLLKKKNTFTDFIDCGKHLVNNKYASEDMLFAMGGSAGGLLMGAIVNMNPELFNGVIASVPFVEIAVVKPLARSPFSMKEAIRGSSSAISILVISFIIYIWHLGRVIN